MGNSDSPHSKKLRAETAKKYDKKKYKKMLIRFRIDDDKKIIDAIKKSGKSATAFFRDLYNNNMNKKQEK